MWGHAQAAISPLIAVADMYARSGNTSLYDLTAATQVINGSGGTVGLSTVIGLFAAIANGTTLLYGTTSAGEQDAAHLLTWNGNDGDYYLRFLFDARQPVLSQFGGNHSNDTQLSFRQYEYGMC